MSVASRIALYLVALGAGAWLAEVTANPAAATAAATPSRARVVEPASMAVTTDRPAPVAVEPAAEISDQLEAASAIAEPAIAEEPSNPDPLGSHLQGGQIITGATPHRLLLFTFDDGPDLRTTPLLLDRLDAAGIKAVFFLTASRIVGGTPSLRQQATLAREIVERGHMVGNHTVDHVQLPLLDDDAVNAELTSAEQIFERVFGARPWLIRPPFGAHSDRVDYYLARRGYTSILWNLGSGDFQVRTAQEVFDLWLRISERRERENGERGGIILLHDTYSWSVDAFQMILAHIMERNCELLAAGEELYDIVDDPSFFYVPRGDAHPGTLAPPADPPAEILEARQARLREETRRRCESLATL